jgi:hypothetical protein
MSYEQDARDKLAQLEAKIAAVNNAKAKYYGLIVAAGVLGFVLGHFVFV